MKYNFEINQKNFDVTISGITGNTASVLVNGQPYNVRIGDPSKTSAQQTAAQSGVTAQATTTPMPIQSQKTEVSFSHVVQSQGEPILAPIPGLIMEVRVKVGDAVSAGQIVSILEAMKMENSLTTHVSGTVKEIRVEKGSEVSTGDVILIVG
jgi:biotin carboxyl carrier protein